MGEPTLVRCQRALLVPLPLLSIAHVLAIRVGWMVPGWGPVIAVTVLPVASLVMGVAAGRRAPTTLLVLAALELAWCATYAAMVGMAIGLRSL